MVTPKLKTLKNSHEIVALLDARGCKITEIEEATGYSYNHIWRIQNEIPQYKVLVTDLKKQIQDQVVAGTVDNITRFNSKVPIMTDNLEELALYAKKAGVRLSATKDWLDRAPDAPKRVSKQEHTEERKIIFSVAVSDNIRAALADVGQTDVVELLEGEDYTICETQNVKNVDED